MRAIRQITFEFQRALRTIQRFFFQCAQNFRFDQRVDALQVLSEGHIRCLGLAILLAKATSIGSPVLIFDDAVNAIDHDHRHGIKETIFAGDRFLTTQIVVTCHSQEFIKDVRNAIPRERRKDCQEYAITHHEGDHHPRVHRDVPSSAYIDKARSDLGRFQLRDALANSRRALEMLSTKAWKWLGSHELGELKLTMHGPTSPMNARDLCDAIRIKLRDTPTFDHPSKVLLHDALEEVLSASNLTWKYLNAGRTRKRIGTSLTGTKWNSSYPAWSASTLWNCAPAGDRAVIAHGL